MGAKARIGQAIFGRLIHKGAVALVDEELIFLIAPLQIARVADVNIQEAIAVHIHHAYARAPGLGPGHACGFGHVFEFEIALIDKQAIGQQVGREVHIREAVIVYIPQGYTTAIVVVAVAKNIEGFVEGKGVFEGHAGELSGHARKKRIGFRDGGLTCH